jgi:hypothetical protein
MLSSLLWDDDTGILPWLLEGLKKAVPQAAADPPGRLQVEDLQPGPSIALPDFLPKIPAMGHDC